MKLWVSCPVWTVQVDVDDRDVIIWAAPIVSRFTGQPLWHLREWCRQKGWPLTMVQL